LAKDKFQTITALFVTLQVANYHKHQSAIMNFGKESFLTQKSSIKYTWGSKTLSLSKGSFSTPKIELIILGKQNFEFREGKFLILKKFH